jgi:membrane protein YdbS with pleckstrin-like domain
MRTGYRRRGAATRIIGILLVIWLIIGAIAAGQRGYYSNAKTNCASAATIVVTILAGPLNYVGVNPKVDCSVPQPSK